MRIYRMETLGGGSNYEPILDKQNGQWVDATEALEALLDMRKQRDEARKRYDDEFERSCALGEQLIERATMAENRQSVPHGRVRIEMSDAEYDRMRKQLGKQWEWHDVVLTVPASR